MEMKRFIGRDVRSALRLVREQLGPDAMVLSNSRTVDGVEVVAVPAAAVASLAKGSSRTPNESGKTERSRQRPVRLRTGRNVDSDRAEMAVDGQRTADRSEIQSVVDSLRDPPRQIEASSLVSMQRELSSLRKMLEAQLFDGDSEITAFRPGIHTRELTKRLRGLGLSIRFAGEIAAATALLAEGEQAWREALAAIRERVQVGGDLAARGGCIALVGPTGAGKTTTLCKLAVRHVLSHGAGSLGIISLDRFRLGAGETLRALGRVIGAEIHEPADPSTLGSLLDDLADKKLVLIDAAGLKDGDESREAQQDALAAVSERVRTLLVLPANSQARSLERTVAAYRQTMLSALVITRLDETVSLGEAVELSVRHKLPIVYTTDGPEIPEDIEVASAAGLLRSLEQFSQSLANERSQDSRDTQLSDSWKSGSYNDSNGLAIAAV